MTTERPTRRFPVALGRVAGAGTKDSSPSGAAARASTTALLRPQRHVAAAHADATRARPAAGLGLDSADVRARMVERLRREGAGEPRVLAAFAEVPRHLFVDAALATQAYETPACRSATARRSRSRRLSRACSSCCSAARTRRPQATSAPCSRSAPAAAIRRRCSAVSAGASSRSSACDRLHDKARTLLATMRETRLRLVYGDGLLGHAPGAPYDSIVAAAGGSEIPQAWLDQLAVGGRLVSPVQQPGGRGQVLVVVDRRAEGFARTIHGAVKFVPLKSGLAR
jgi:protein-L-isoaspartate(D-aspartate) O-methyltransferase